MKNSSFQKKVGFICLLNFLLFALALTLSFLLEKHTSMSIPATVLLLSAAAGVLTFWMGRFVVKSITIPLDEIGSAARMAASGKLDAHVSFTSQDELGALAENIRTLIKNLQRYISDISRVLSSIAEGDMTASAGMDYPNDFLPIKNSMEKIVASTDHLLKQMQTSAQQVSSGAEQISSAAQSMAQGSTEQAASAEELAASINEISNKIKQNADHAQNARTEMDKTTEEIRQGGGQMQRLVRARNRIEKTSKKIMKFIKVID